MHSHFCWIKDQIRAAVHVWKWLQRQLRISRWSWSSTNQDWWVFSLTVFFFKVNVLTKLLYLFSAASNRFVLKKQTKKQNKKFFTPARAKSTFKLWIFKELQEWKISIIHACSYEVLHKNMKNWGMKLKILHFNIAA